MATVTTAQARRVTVAIDKFCSRVVSKIVLEIEKELTKRTMKVTTLASVNWIPSVGRPYVHRFGKKKMWNPAFRRSLVPTSVAIQRMGRSLVKAYRLQDDKLYIRNNIPYIGHLDEGRNRQKAKAWVAASIDAALARSTRSIRI